MSKPKTPVDIPPGVFQPPDPRVTCLGSSYFCIVRLKESDEPVVVDIRGRCHACGQGQCMHLKIAVAERKRLCEMYPGGIPDSESILLDAMDRAMMIIAGRQKPRKRAVA